MMVKVKRVLMPLENSCVIASLLNVLEMNLKCSAAMFVIPGYQNVVRMKLPVLGYLAPIVLVVPLVYKFLSYLICFFLNNFLLLNSYFAASTFHDSGQRHPSFRPSKGTCTFGSNERINYSNNCKAACCYMSLHERSKGRKRKGIISFRALVENWRMVPNKFWFLLYLHLYLVAYSVPFHDLAKSP